MSPMPAERAALLQDRLRARAVDLGLCPRDAAVEATSEAIETMLEREVRVPDPTSEECRRWYDHHPRAFVAGELVFARHILFAITPGTPVEALRRKAEEALFELRAHPERFADRARELSNCTSASVGGALGQLARGDSVPEFEAEVFGRTDDGVLPTLVKSRHGFHVVLVERRVAGRRVPFAAVEAQIAAHLKAASLRRALAQYADELVRAC
jgi:peptidyl-prolyl cis-trans isomerase C